MKYRFVCALIIFFVVVTNGCIGFWTVVGTTVYMKTRNHQTVTVQLKSEPGKIYAAMLRAVEKNKVEIKKKNESKFLIEGVKNGRSASVYVKDVGKGLSQLIVTVDADDKKNSREELALEIVNNICSEVGEKCEIKN
jgi:hypothetical protein